MESTTIGILIAVVGFALFGAFYVIYGAKRGKAEGKTERTWCLPAGHGDIDVPLKAKKSLRATCVRHWPTR